MCFLGMNAQKLRFGVEGGNVNTTMESNFAGFIESEISSGYFIGFFADYTLNCSFKIRPELSFVQASNDGISSNFILLPVMLKYYPNEKFY